MNAKDVMTTPVVTVSPETPVAQIAKRLLQRRISAVPVIDAAGRPVGIVSEGDLMRRLEAGGERHPSWWLSIVAEPETQAREYVKAHGSHARDVMTRASLHPRRRWATAPCASAWLRRYKRAAVWCVRLERQFHVEFVDSASVTPGRWAGRGWWRRVQEFVGWTIRRWL